MLTLSPEIVRDCGLNRRIFAGYGTQAGPTYQSTVNYTYDTGNRLTGITDSVTGAITRGYDGLDDLLSETTPQGTVAYTYDADRRKQTMTPSGQAQIGYTFDNASRLSSIVQGASTVGFGYDSNGRRTSMTLPNGVAASFSYDAASQLAGINYQGGALAPQNLTYTYDLAGRRIGVGGSMASTQLPTAVSSAAYNANNQLTQWGATAMTYDPNGSTLNDGMNSYVWDARNRLISADNNGASFSYDPLGRRVSKTLMSTTTNFLYDGANAVQESGTNGTANLLTGGIDERFMRTSSTETDNYLTDALGSTVALTDATGATEEQYSYGPYGMLSASSGTTTNSYTYTGRETDGGLGINYYRARYYNPTTGRFLSEDPMGFAGSGPNLYAYAGDNPISFDDPFGLTPPQYPTWWELGTRILSNGGFIYYGNWGGPGWSGGQLTPYEDLSPADQQNLAPPIDAQDACYMQHDLCYSRARTSNNGITTTRKCQTPQQRKSENDYERTCDGYLMMCLGNINSSTHMGWGNQPSGYNGWSEMAEPFFSVREMWP